VFLVLILASVGQPGPMVGIDQPLRPHLAVDLDGGISRDRDRRVWQAFGRAGVGALWFDGQRLLATTVELGQPWSSERTLGLAAQFAHIQTGLGATATALRELRRGGFGLGVGVSFSFLHAQALVLTRGPVARTATFFLRVPLGLLRAVYYSRSR
jgi:hypothetical protein